MSSTVVEIFTSPNKKTKSGMPPTYRWRVKDGPVVQRSTTSFASEHAALMNVARNIVVSVDAVLRRPGKADVPWIR